jgi:hypothetical protein
LSANFKENSFRAASFTPAEQPVFNEFPRYSITFYDDQDFKYKRQSVDGKPVLSKIISDDFYPFNLSYNDRTNYIAGRSNTLKVFFAKILVYKSISQDSVGQTSNVFYLTRTQNLGNAKTVYYSVQCVEKNSQYTVYSSRIQLNNSDFINQFDGEAFFTLVGNFSVSLEYPISLTINNTATTSIIPTTTTPVYNTIDTKVNNLNFYSNVVVNFDYYQYSDSFDYDFSPLSITLTNETFSSEPVIYTTNTSSGTSIRFNFLEGYSIANLNNFALTLTNSSAGYNPNNDTLFSLTFRLSNGEFLSVNACEIFNNFETNYFNVVFDFNDVIWPGSYINYFILEIKTLTSVVTNPYSITYLNFVKESSSVNSLSLKSFSILSDNSTYTYNLLKEKVDVSSLNNQLVILNGGMFSTVEALLKIKDDSNFQITTQYGSIILPESALVKTENNFVPVFDLQKNMKVRYNDLLEPIISIKVMTSSFVTMIDTYDEEDYFLNGYLVKNPFFSKIVEREILGKKYYDVSFSEIEINQKNLQVKKDAKFSFSNEEIFLKENFSNEILIRNTSSVEFSALISCSSPVLFGYDKDVKSFSDQEIIKLKLKNDLTPIILKSKDSFSIKKLLIIHEF